ncbi:MAG: hypothetical protein KGI69_01620 [Patescibacteria group bacterium]|nr:hypothetical protein [Patescibacteria group bacterium]
MKKLFSSLFSGFNDPVKSGKVATGERPATLSCLKNPPPAHAEHPRQRDENREVRPEPPVAIPAVPATESPYEKGLDDWWDILENESASHIDHAKAFEEVLKSSNDLGDFGRLYDAVGSRDPLLPALMSKLGAFKASFSEWADAYEGRDHRDDYSDLLLERSMSLAKSPGEWLSLWEKAENSHDEDLGKVTEALDKLEWTKEQWGELRSSSDADSEPETLATRKLVQFCETAPDVVSFYLEYVENWNESNEADEAIFKRLFSLATRQEARIISALADDNDALREAADEFLKS